jgi:hypothetical protein
MGYPECIFFREILFEQLVFELQPVPLLEVVVVFGASFKELPHFILDAFLNLSLLFVEFPLQQLGAVLHEEIAVHEIVLACVSHFNYPQTSLDFSFVIEPFSKLLHQHFLLVQLRYLCQPLFPCLLGSWQKSSSELQFLFLPKLLPFL